MKIIAKKVVESSRFDVINHSDILKLVEKGYCVYVKMAEKSNLELFEMGVFYPRSARIITLLGNEVKIYKFNNSIDTDYTICFDNLEIGMMVKMMDYVGYIVGKRNRAKIPSVEIRLISSYKNVDEDTMYYTSSELILNDTYILEQID